MFVAGAAGCALAAALGLPLLAAMPFIAAKAAIDLAAHWHAHGLLGRLRPKARRTESR
jgi:hypothetical protein